MKIAILQEGCVRENTMKYSFLNQMKTYNFERAISLEEADYLIYITCTGVGEVIHKCMNDIATLDLYSKQEYNNLNVIVVGCLVRHHSELLERFKDNPNMKFISNKDWIIPTLNYINHDNKRNSYKTRLNNITRLFYNNNTALQIFLEEGCTNHCSFCKFNYNNPKVSSIPYDHALKHLEKCIKAGTKSITLGGDNLTLYGIDLYKKPCLHKFIHELSLIDGLSKIHVKELVAGNMYTELIDELVNNPKVKSVAMQLESASDRLLKLMNRNYTLEEYDYYAKRLIDAGKNVSTVLMSAFPTETLDDLDKTISYLKERGIRCTGICEYSDFDFIPSSKLEQFNKREKRKHSIYLRDAIRINDLNILTRDMSKLDNLVLVGKVDGYSIFECNNCIPVVSKNKKYIPLPLGTEINQPPKRLVRKCKLDGRVAYKL